MCIAAPMKILSIEENGSAGRVALSGSEMRVNLSLVSPKVGDYVLIHAGCAIEIVKKDSAEEILDLLASLEECADDA